ncbi:DNA internalization-related competence protein ComEC/Rec2 [Hydrogenovibrio kuenenii]|uniref:DNA internalization-related competence protein ComEC/Rec2 n=1 Tax=Hydrogenovibrio kuenenii TaxID=63658 RepID=UPI000464F6B9|nr:DNA internalization-related competence protein ComEC/Rec2 [Hydrogenovibrio kuenenii]
MFRYFVLGYISALVGLYHVSETPWYLGASPNLFTNLVFWLVVSALLISILVVIKSRLYQTIQLIRIIIQIILGALIAFLLSFLVENMQGKLPESAFNHKVWVEGEIVGLTTEKPSGFGKQKVQFTLAVDKLNHHETAPTWQIFAPKVRLSWYLDKRSSVKTKDLPKAGETRRFYIKLKPNHYSLNPGAFDYETYLFQQHIQAHGYILNAKKHHLNSTTPQIHALRLAPSSQTSLQQTVRQQLAPWFQKSSFGGVFSALLYGDKSNINAEQWQLFRQTGTIHLMAISGLHIGIMATIGFWLFGFLWRGAILYFPYKPLREKLSFTPKMIWSSSGAAMFAFVYMELAGFAIPTVRAGLMVLVVLVFIVFRRRFHVWSALALAAFLIVLLDSRAVLSQGFWLSFSAVAIIYTVIASPGFSERRTWQQLLWLQLALTIGMMPVLAWFYGQIPIVSFFANLIAVPVVTLLALPLLMATAVFILLFGHLFPSIGSNLIGLNDEIWQVLWFVLNELETFAHHFITSGYWQNGQVSALGLIFVYAALAFWLNMKWPQTFKLNGKKYPWRESYRWLGAVGLVALFFIFSFLHTAVQKSLAPGQVKLTLLDVGQGQAMVFETAAHTVVYDTGPKFSDALDGASMAVLPYLTVERRNKLDLLVVSHSDMDHAGGTNTLLQNISVHQAISGQANILNHRLKNQNTMHFSPCYAGQSWTFDQVHFEVLSPTKGAKFENDNDTSCVLRVSTGSQAMMVMGDASKHIEQNLIQLKKAQGQAEKLYSQILIAGHHGSHTATSEAWLKALDPKLVLFSAGYLNRYHFPNESVVQHVHKLGISMLNTACSGAIQLEMTPNSFQVTNRQRIDHKNWYHHQCYLSQTQ